MQRKPSKYITKLTLPAEASQRTTKGLEEVLENLSGTPLFLKWSGLKDFKELGFEGKLKEMHGCDEKRLFLLEKERVAHKLTPLNDATEEEEEEEAAAAAIVGPRFQKGKCDHNEIQKKTDDGFA